MKIIDYLNQHQLKKQIFILLGVTAVIFVVVFLVESLLFLSNSKNNSRSLVEETALNIRNTAELNYKNLVSLSDYISLQTGVVSFLSEQNARVRYDYYDQVVSTFKSVMLLNSNIEDVFLYDIRSKRIYANSYQKAVEIVDKINIRLDALQYVPAYHCFVISTPVYSSEWSIEKTEIIGYAIITISPDFLAYSPSVLRNNVVHLIFSDEAGNEVWRSSESKMESHNRGNIESIQILAELGLVLKAVYMPEIHVLPSLASLSFIFFVVFSIALIGLIWIIEIRNIISPIHEFNSQIVYLKNNPKSFFQYNEPIKGYPEICLLHDSFFDLKNEVNQLNIQIVRMNAEVYEQKILRTQADLQYLRSQINPHFLYNTFETIIGIAAEHEETDIMKIIKSLSSIFSYSLRGQPFVFLSVELKMITDYLFIQKIRFTDKLEVFFDISEDTLIKEIPKMILQPIVENAIIHGMEESLGVCRIRISAHLIEAESLEISVSNTGPCIEEDVLRILENKFAEPLDDMLDIQNESIGLSNVNRRLKLNYGKACCIRVQSSSELTVFTIVIPKTAPKGK